MPSDMDKETVNRRGFLGRAVATVAGVVGGATGLAALGEYNLSSNEKSLAAGDQGNLGNPVAEIPAEVVSISKNEGVPMTTPQSTEIQSTPTSPEQVAVFLPEPRVPITPVTKAPAAIEEVTPFEPVHTQRPAISSEKASS